jgi:predicted metal-dependent hydrolase
MNSKKVDLPGVGEVTLIKRAQSRSLRLSVTTNGVRVSLPRWTSFSAGAAFAQSHAAWIQLELAKQNHTVLENGQRIGKLHYLRFEQVLNGQAITSRVTGTEIVVRMQQGETTSDPQVQKRASMAATRGLKREAERLLPPRLQNLAVRHNLSYNSVTVKSLKRRWGSCDSHQMIALNLYLMELPWEYIDYVLCHELTHTVIMNHGEDFWKLLITLEPRARLLSKQLRKHHPAVGSWQPAL